MRVYDNIDFKEEMGFPVDGQKVTFKKPIEMHWFTNVVKDQELLEIGKEYTVRKTQLNSSSSYIWLQELEPYDTERDLPFFNLWCFNWDGKPESWFDKMKREKELAGEPLPNLTKGWSEDSIESLKKAFKNSKEDNL